MTGAEILLAVAVFGIGYLLILSIQVLEKILHELRELKLLLRQRTPSPYDE